jgi:nitrogen regulatory protein PII
MKELKVYCRKERVDELVHALRLAGVPHMTVTHVRSLGSGVDPKHAGISWEPVSSTLRRRSSSSSVRRRRSTG